ncbi:hypothetical protein AFLA_012458 [Aspergillus flavus NRRL3357]|nr:hypothetical protein AFLA_012458 [Aspergillus flavus NRRL3357]
MGKGIKSGRDRVGSILVGGTSFCLGRPVPLMPFSDDQAPGHEHSREAKGCVIFEGVSLACISLGRSNVQRITRTLLSHPIISIPRNKSATYFTKSYANDPTLDTTL